MKKTKKILKILLFLSAFFIEIDVRSQDFSSNVNFCKNDNSLNCVIYNDSKKVQELKIDDSYISLGSNSLLIKKNKKDFRLVKGVFWIKNNNEIKFDSKFINIVEAREFWVLLNKQKQIIRAIDSNLRLKIRGGNNNIYLNAGMENWFSWIGAKGTTLTGTPKVIELSEHLPLWYEFYSGEKEDFKKTVYNFISTWRYAFSYLNDYYQYSVNRSIASYKKQEEVKKNQYKKYQKEKARIMQMFRKRNLMDFP